MYIKRVLSYLIIFNSLALVGLLSEILGGPKFTLVGPSHGRPLGGKILTYSQVLAYIYIILNFQLCISGTNGELSV